jgi:hypothetical protein
MTRKTTRLSGLALTLVVALTASGCTLGDRTRHAAALVRSPSRAVAAGTATGTMSFRLAVKPIGDRPEGGAAIGGAVGNITPPPAFEIPIVVDFTHDTASLSLPGAAGSPEPAVVLDGTRILVRRATTSGISSRRWVALDLATVDEVSEPDGDDFSQNSGMVMVAFPGPLQLVELLAGTLTGSTKRAGPATYVANLSREKANRELDLGDRAVEVRDNALRLIAVTDEVHPAQITLDAEGRPASFDVRLRPHFRADRDVEVRVTTRLAYERATVAIPAAEDTLVLETVGQLLAELVNLGRALGGER